MQQQHEKSLQQQPQNQQQIPQQPTTTTEPVQNPSINLQQESAFRTIETPPLVNAHAQAGNIKIQNRLPTHCVHTESLGMFINKIQTVRGKVT